MHEDTELLLPTATAAAPAPALPTGGFGMYEDTELIGPRLAAAACAGGAAGRRRQSAAGFGDGFGFMYEDTEFIGRAPAPSHPAPQPTAAPRPPVPPPREPVSSGGGFALHEDTEFITKRLRVSSAGGAAPGGAPAGAPPASSPARKVPTARGGSAPVADGAPALEAAYGLSRCESGPQSACGAGAAPASPFAAAAAAAPGPEFSFPSSAGLERARPAAGTALGPRLGSAETVTSPLPGGRSAPCSPRAAPPPPPQDEFAVYEDGPGGAASPGAAPVARLVVRARVHLA